MSALPCSPGGPTLAAPRRCLNCGAPAPGRFCAECGQATAADPQSLAATLGAAFERGLGRRSRLRQTLAKLILAPGALTVEHRAGRRARYLQPLQLYLLASVVVFGAAQLFGLNLSLRLIGDEGIHLLRSMRPSAVQDGAQGQRLTPIQIILDHADTPGVRRFRALAPDDRFAYLKARRAPAVSWLVLFVVPFFALTLGIFYRGRHRNYSEHLVFGLHSQAFLLLALLVEAGLSTSLANALSLWVIAYFTLALKRVYGGSWPATLVRAVAILALYFAIFVGMNLLLVFGLLAF
jgi:hypothetical protein